MHTSHWLRSVAVLSVLGLLLPACGGGDADVPATAATEEGSATDDAGTAPEEQETAAEGSASDLVGTSETVERGSVTAYVVAYHWGWAVFDEEGTELERLDVPVGTEVELIAVNDHASAAIAQLPGSVAEAIGSISFHERAHHNVEMGRMPDPQVDEGISLSEALAAAHDGHGHMGPTQDHGLMVTGIGVEAFLDAHADEPARLVFTVEHEGVHQFRCTEKCGVGHESQRWDMIFASA